MLEGQTQNEVSTDKCLGFFDFLPLPSSYKIKHLLTTPTWTEPAKCINLNAIGTTPMPLMSSSNALPLNYANDHPLLDCNTDIGTIQVL